MSQFGMQMPGGRVTRGGPIPDVFTVLIFCGVVGLLVAAVMLWLAATKVSPGAHPFAVQQEGQIKLKGSN